MFIRDENYNIVPLSYGSKIHLHKNKYTHTPKHKHKPTRAQRYTLTQIVLGIMENVI